MNRTLPPYSGPFTICPKCGNDQAYADFKVGLRCGAYHDETIRALNDGDTTSEWLCRRCKMCNFAWDEACLDTEDADQGEESVEEPPAPPAAPPVAPPVKAKALIGQQMVVLHEDPMPDRLLREARAAAAAQVFPRQRRTWG